MFGASTVAAAEGGAEINTSQTQRELTAKTQPAKDSTVSCAPMEWEFGLGKVSWAFRGEQSIAGDE